MVCSANKEWVEEKTCAAGEGCVQDKCTPCEPGVSQPKCQSDKVLECGADGQWKEKQDCTNLKVSCHAGACGNCKVGDRSCSGKVPQLCGSDAQWKAEPACPVFCSNKDGKCHDCVPDAAGTAPKCDPTGKFLRSCNDSGDFVSGMTCSAKGCVVGRTKCSDCTPNTDTQCVPISGGSRGETCNASGEWSNPQMCTGGQGCIGGACKACQPGVSANVCRNNKVETCDSTGAWVVLDNCDTKGVTCANATCGQCMKDATGCDGKVPQVCGADGKWVKSPACGVYCHPADASCGDCVPSSTPVCISGALKTCSAAGKRVNVSPACDYGCKEGETGCYKCPLDQQTCNSTGTAVVKCNGADYSTLIDDCTKKTPVNADTLCSASKCDYKCKNGFNSCSDGTCRVECPILTTFGNGGGISPSATNRDGRVIVGGANSQGFRWDQATGAVTALNYVSTAVGTKSAAARAVSPDGSLVAGWENIFNPPQGLYDSFVVVWSGATGSALGNSVDSSDGTRYDAVAVEGNSGASVIRQLLAASYSIPSRCSVVTRVCESIASQLNDVIGSYDPIVSDASLDGTLIAFTQRLETCGVTTKGQPPAAGGECLSSLFVSADGNFVFGTAGGKGYRWRVGQTLLEETQGISDVVDVSQDGAVAVSATHVWRLGKGTTAVSTLRGQVPNAPSLTDMVATAVSLDGLVAVGRAKNSAGVQVAWRMVLP